VVTKDRILEAAAKEIETNGLTQFRVKRVASDAGISVALLYSYFEDREGLIAATIVHRFRQVLIGTAEIFTKPLRNVETPEQLQTALYEMIAEAQSPERDDARLLRIESISFARHNPVARDGLADARRETSTMILDAVRPLAEKKLLKEGMSPVAFARIWYALFFGQISLEGEHDLAIPQNEWLTALDTLADGIISQTIRTAP
jgi:AcrR family transcriptional regulator